jgi:peptide methionine sulfoxide reductase msrA/msrB
MTSHSRQWAKSLIAPLAVIGLLAAAWSLGYGRGSRADSAAKAARDPNAPYIVLGMGCFWGSEKRMQQLPGVVDVEAGYAGGDTVHPNYEALHDAEEAIMRGQAIKNHAEVVKVYYDPQRTTLERVLIQFWENHDPTQGNRQGADVGSNRKTGARKSSLLLTNRLNESAFS